MSYSFDFVATTTRLCIDEIRRRGTTISSNNYMAYDILKSAFFDIYVGLQERKIFRKTGI
jgi:hypothetical protein